MIRITLAAAFEMRPVMNALCAEAFGDVTQETPVFSEVVWNGDGGVYCVASLDIPDTVLIDLPDKVQNNGLALALWIVGDEEATPRASQGMLCVLAGVDSRYAIDTMGLPPAA